MVGRQPDAAPEQIQEHISIPGEYRSEYVSLPLVRSKPFQLFTRAATAVIEQDRGKPAAALGAPEQCVQRDRPVVQYDGFRTARRMVRGRRREPGRQNQRR